MPLWQRQEIQKVLRTKILNGGVDGMLVDLRPKLGELKERIEELRVSL